MEKICTKCKISKPATEEYFYWRKSLNKFENQCRVCRAQRNKTYAISNKEKIKVYKKTYTAINKDKITKQQKAYSAQNKQKIKAYKKNYANIHRAKIKLYQKVYAVKNKDKIEVQHKAYAVKNKEKIKVYKKNYNIVNKQKIIQKRKIYYANNKQEINIYKKNYNLLNKEKINLQQKNYNQARRKTDLIFKLRTYCSTMIFSALKVNSGSKNGQSILQHLPYTIIELKTHLEAQFEPWMTWQNHGVYNSKIWNDHDSTTWTWQLDHIIPHSTFKYTSMDSEEFQKCWSLSNLRPLASKDNILDGATRKRHDINLIKENK